MKTPSTESNLLFGVLALQADLLTAAQFAEACTVWASRKTSPLADLVVERGWLSVEQADSVRQLLDLKLKAHANDVHHTLQVEARPAARDLLASIADPEIRRVLSTVTRTAEASTTTADYAPPLLKRYSLIRLHAVGGIGQVWLARDNTLGREVALKELRPDHKRNEVDRVRFVREAQVAGQLEHPHIVPVYEMDFALMALEWAH